MTVRRIGRYVVTAKTNRVFLVDDTVASDTDLSPDQAISLGEALLLAAREAVRFTTRREPPCMCGGARWSNTTDNPTGRLT